jgi:hypothetical protein
MSVFISLVLKGFHGRRYFSSSERSFRFPRGFASCPKFCRLPPKHGSLARNAGRVQRGTETRRRGGRDSEGKPSSANSDNVTVQRLSPLR